MNVNIRGPRRLYSGLLIVAFGLAGAYFASGLKFGTAAAMGPGFLPTICCWLLVLLGVIELLKVTRENADVIEQVVPRPVLMIFLAVGLFALLINRAGLAPTIFITALVSSHAVPTKLWEAILLAAAAAIVVPLVFVTILGMPIPVWPEFD